jgi:sugar phosphate isomerase/epimerase
MLHRRDLLKGAIGFSAMSPAMGRSPSETPPGLGFSLYGMRSLELPAALALCAQTGYDCVELAAMEGWPGDTAAMNEAAIGQLRQSLAEHQLRISAIMENLLLTGSDDEHARRLQRLEAALQLARRVQDERRPVVETILGGSPSQWPDVRDLFLRRLKDWAELAERQEVRVALKAHVSGAVHRPEHVVDLLTTIDSPWLRAAYDYSHFQLQELNLHDSLRRLLPHTVFIHVKDGRRREERIEFLLPGEGSIDYVDYFTQLRQAGYEGDVVVEVSGQIHSRSGYRPEDAARRSFAALAAALDNAG